MAAAAGNAGRYCAVCQVPEDQAGCRGAGYYGSAFRGLRDGHCNACYDMHRIPPQTGDQRVPLRGEAPAAGSAAARGVSVQEFSQQRLHAAFREDRLRGGEETFRSCTELFTEARALSSQDQSMAAQVQAFALHFEAFAIHSQRPCSETARESFSHACELLHAWSVCAS